MAATIDPATYNPADTALRFDPVDGSPVIPTNPAAAAARLKALDGDANIVAVILDPQHPLHKARTAERAALQVIASRGNSVFNPAGRAAIEGQGFHDKAREEVFRRNVASKVDAIMPSHG